MWASLWWSTFSSFLHAYHITHCLRLGCSSIWHQHIDGFISIGWRNICTMVFHAKKFLWVMNHNTVLCWLPYPRLVYTIIKLNKIQITWARRESLMERAPWLKCQQRSVLINLTQNNVYDRGGCSAYLVEFKRSGSAYVDIFKEL